MSHFQPANVHQLRIGDFVLSTLLEAQADVDFGLVPTISENEARALHEASRRPMPPRVTINAYLLDTGRQKILIDTGFGGLAGADGTRLLENLETIGVAPADIDTVVITHIHTDHVGGLIDGEGNPALPQARVLVPAGELDYWGGDMPPNLAEAQRHQFQAVQHVLAAVGSQIQAFEGTHVMPGITRVPLPGHTPDHSGYRIASGTDQILIWGDIVHLPQIQFPRPDASILLDSDYDQAAATRRRIMVEVAETGEMIGGHHLDFPGVGHVVADGKGFRFLPHLWRPTV